MSKKKQVYLAGAIDAAPDGGTTWRLGVTPSLEAAGFRVFNPCIETDGQLAKHLGWDHFDFKKWSELKHGDPDFYKSTAKWIVDNDLIAVINSNIILIYFDKYVPKGAGTYGEATVGRYMDIPVYIVMASDYKVADLPAWFVGCATEIFSNDDFTSAVEAMKDEGKR